MFTPSGKFYKISEAENALLIRESSRNTPLQLAFGSGGVAIIVPQDTWAIPLVEQWRGNTFTDGAGI